MDRKGERLSALLDGELQDTEVDDVLDALRADPELTQRWNRYHLISDALRNDLPDAIDRSLAQRVTAALELEPALLVPHARRSKRYPVLKQVAGLAAAATVATVAVLLSLGTDPTVSDGTPPVAAASPNTEVAQWDRGQSSIESRLNSYVVNHTEYSTSTGMQGMLPYMRIVGVHANERALNDGR